MSRNAKSLLIVLGVAVVFCIAAVAFALAGAGMFVNKIKDGIVMTPEKVHEMAQDFIHYELPEGYSERMGMDLVIYKMILIGSSDGTGTTQPMIFIANFQGQNLSPEEMARQMKQSVEQQSGTNGVQMKVVETRNVTIDGKEVPLTVSEGTSSSGNFTLRQWITAFPGKKGTVMILIQGAADGWDDSLFETFLASITT